MKSFIAASFAVISSVSAHSWLECTNHDDSVIRGWMQGNSTLSPPVIIDPEMPWYSEFCHGWPRAKHNPGDWLDESSNYVWNIAANSFKGEKNACHPNQRGPNYDSNAPMATANPGGSFKLRFGGNGHTRGDNTPGKSPGVVSVYWKGAPEQEITDISEFTSTNKLATAGFSDDSFSYPADPNVKTPVQGLVDKGNWMTVKLPANIQSGRHMMVWVWSSDDGAPQWSTCFDVQVGGAASNPSSPAPSTPAVSAPAIPVPAMPAVVSSIAAAAPSVPVTAPAYSAPAVIPNQKNPEPAPAPSPAPAPAPALAPVPAPAPAVPSASASVAPAPVVPAPVIPSAIAAPATEPSTPPTPHRQACKAHKNRVHPRDF